MPEQWRELCAPEQWAELSDCLSARALGELAPILRGCAAPLRARIVAETISAGGEYADRALIVALARVPHGVEEDARAARPDGGL
jgi:hypothetical protein